MITPGHVVERRLRANKERKHEEKIKGKPLREYELTKLHQLGWIMITSTGEENIYFTLEDGTEGFAKYLG